MTSRLFAGALLAACAPSPPPAAPEPEPPLSAPAPAEPRAMPVDLAGIPIAVDDAPPAAIVIPAPTYRGTVDAAQVGALIHNESARFRACGLTGTAVVRAVVGTDGKVRSASFTKQQLTGDKDCLLRAVEATRFPAPDDTAEVILPFIFRAAK